MSITRCSIPSDLSHEARSAAVVDLLSKPATYGRGTDAVQCVETHISWVFLTQRHAYKLKKPVRYDFLDFTTPELRREACHQEVELNRRLAPDVYLGVVPITASSTGRLGLGGPGSEVDWVVKMRRLPEDRALDRLIGSGELTDSNVDQIASKLVNFYRGLPPVSVRTEEYRREIEDHVQHNRAELLDPEHGLDSAVVKRVHAAQLRVLRLFPEVFDNRVCDGRVVEGHGDLRPEHIYLDPTPTIIDCIEFNLEFRQLDVLDELSFLAVECAYLDASSVGGRFLQQYCQSSGDQPPPQLLPFYMAYRACVRAKVNALRAKQVRSDAVHSVPERDRDTQPHASPPTLVDDHKLYAAAGKYLVLADRYATEIGPPLLLIVRGLTGVGKSTLASALADSLGIELLQTDSVQRELFGPTADPADYDDGIYRPDSRVKVYDELLRRAGELLAAQMSVPFEPYRPVTRRLEPPPSIRSQS